MEWCLQDLIKERIEEVKQERKKINHFKVDDWGEESYREKEEK